MNKFDIYQYCDLKYSESGFLMEHIRKLLFFLLLAHDFAIFLHISPLLMISVNVVLHSLQDFLKQHGNERLYLKNLEWIIGGSWLQIYQNSKNISVFYHSVTYFYNFHIPAGFFSLIFRPFGYRLAQLHHLQTLHLPGFDKGILNLIFEFFYLNLNEKIATMVQVQCS